MTKYKIHIDKPLPDPSRIARHKDFDSLYHQYQVNTRFEFWRNLYRKPQYFAAVVGIVAILFLVFEAEETASPLVQAPVPGWNLPAMEEELTAETGESIPISEALTLYVPENAFVDEEGSVISGPVQLKVRQVQSPTELFLAGVPMNTDSSSALKGLENLALMEVTAWQDGKQMQLQKSLEAIYMTRDTSTSYSVQYLDTVDRAWKQIGQDELEIVMLPPDSTALPPRPEMPAELLALNDLDADTLVAKSMNPGFLPQKPGRPFGVKVKNQQDFPQFRGFEKVYWEFMDTPNSANPWEEGLIGEGKGWEDVRINRLSNRDAFELTFARQANGGLEFRKVIARPMFEAKNQAEADRIYQDRYNRYTVAVEARRQAIENREAKQRKKRELETAYTQSVKDWEAMKSDSTYVCYRSFEFDKLGWVGLSKMMDFSAHTQTVAVEMEKRAFYCQCTMVSGIPWYAYPLAS